MTSSGGRYPTHGATSLGGDPGFRTLATGRLGLPPLPIGSRGDRSLRVLNETRGLAFALTIPFGVLALLFMGDVTTVQWIAVAWVLVLGITAYWRSRDPLHPLVFPILYLATVCLVVPLHVATSRQDLGRVLVHSLDGPAPGILLLGFLTFVVGSMAGLRNVEIQSAATARSIDRPEMMELSGRLLLVASGLLKLVQIRLAAGRVYGENQVGGGAFSLITTLTEGLFLSAIALLCVARHVQGKSPVHLVDLLIVLAYGGASGILLGSRSELIAPMLILLWGLSRYRRVPMVLLLAVTAAVISAFSYIQTTRGASTADSKSPLETTLIDLSSPYYLLDELAARVPDPVGYTSGQTYIAALEMMLPSPIRQVLMPSTDPPATATFIYRDIINFTDVNQGFGFAYPAEAYLNFGLLGVGASGFLLGFLLATAYAASLHLQVGRLVTMVYPLLVACLPYGYRSDSLGMTKMVLYPLIFMALARLGARQARRQSAAGAHNKQGEHP